MLGAFPHTKFLCLSHLFHFMVHFLLRVDKLFFLLYFLLHQPLGHRSRLDPKCGKGQGKANSMWTQWKNVDPNGKYVKRGYNEQRGVMYLVSGIETMQPKLGFPMK